uniref:Uncharacterized protein n=1 Tax=Trypanosoma vivax (strain Y486) TaxID=1055687 RepID=G0UBW3_TRYVY|nr:hypothetical protein, unlikely [Trypanosoma vivax Y486]
MGHIDKLPSRHSNSTSTVGYPSERNSNIVRYLHVAVSALRHRHSSFSFILFSYIFPTSLSPSFSLTFFSFLPPSSTSLVSYRSQFHRAQFHPMSCRIEQNNRSITNETTTTTITIKSQPNDRKASWKKKQKKQ